VSLFDTAERFASIDRSQVVLDPNRCLHALDRQAGCAACFEVCPVQAIQPGKPPVLDAELCQSCLACLPVCPVGAFRADDDVSSLLTCAARVESRTIDLVCGLQPQPENGPQAESTGIRIAACLAGLGSGAYLSLSALGLEYMLLRTEACSACKWGSLKPQIERHAAQANQLLAGWDKAGSVACLEQVDSPVERPLWDAKNPPLSRRDLFRMLGRQGQVAMARAMENGLSASKPQPGRERLRILSALAHLPQPEDEPAISLSGLGFAALNVSADCTACGVCAKACPTEALHFEKNEQETAFTLSFSPQNCTGCELCAHVCAPAAITLDPDPTFETVFAIKEPVTLQAGELVRCERCKTLMADRPGQSICGLCEYRRAHPFGSVLPPGLAPHINKVNRESHK
jgi:ferredoxin